MFKYLKFVPHSSGGVILRARRGYVAGTFLSARTLVRLRWVGKIILFALRVVKLFQLFV